MGIRSLSAWNSGVAERSPPTATGRRLAPGEEQPGTPVPSVGGLAAVPPLASSQDRAGGVPQGAKEPPHHGSQEDGMATTHTTHSNTIVKIIMNDRGNPPGKLAEAELQFTGGVLEGLKLIGFGAPRRR